MDTEDISGKVAWATRMHGAEITLTDDQADRMAKAITTALRQFEEDVPAPDDLEEHIWSAAADVGVSGPALAQLISDIRADL
ncbi:hypothetical protein [Nocardiopsis eucommiae]|uniref:hypothetical protein n=1 Tax=Nocardiopsis eucommiae TaxID=2831970 RepID=UPI003D71838D